MKQPAAFSWMMELSLRNLQNQWQNSPSDSRIPKASKWSSWFCFVWLLVLLKQVFTVYPGQVHNSLCIQAKVLASVSWAAGIKGLWHHYCLKLWFWIKLSFKNYSYNLPQNRQNSKFLKHGREVCIIYFLRYMSEILTFFRYHCHNWKGFFKVSCDLKISWFIVISYL